ncbi:MAG TPA: magnesium transporter, partial [Firmicutes bacterium]|nr:magnesium transporter [Bacillota bacterium]
LPVEKAINRLREIAPEPETIYYIYVTDEKKHLTGVVSLRELIGAHDGVKVEEIMQKNIISVNVRADQEEVARIVSKYNFLAVPVVDDRNYLLGIVTVDDVLDVMEEEATEDFYRLVGTTEIEGAALVDASALHIAGKRLPWLIICLLGGLISGSVIGTFEETLKAVVTLAFFIPVIMDTGGNVGAQSSTVFVRGLATGEISSVDVWKYFFRELRVGLTMGIITGVISGAAAVLLHGAPILGIVVGISMLTTVSLAAAIGIIIPLLFSKLGLDPAITSGPFVTTIKGITGLLIYFLIARFFMGI